MLTMKFLKVFGFPKAYRMLFLLFFLIFSSCKESQKTSDKISIGFSQGLGNHPWRLAMNHSMEIQASLHSEVELDIQKAESSVNKQIQDIQKMIDRKVDVIIISLIDPESLVPVVEKAAAKNIPVILLDRKINSEKYTTYIGADNLEIGKEAANYILSDSKNHKKRKWTLHYWFRQSHRFCPNF